VLLDQLPNLELDASEPIIYDSPIGVRLLYQDPVSGAEHYLIRYPIGLQAQWHTHSAAHTIIVLEGQLTANQQRMGPLSYCHFPAGTVMHHAPGGSQGWPLCDHLDGPYDVTPAVGP
jgi:quercetin dioxygenase-like cupin family protein